MRKTIAAVTTGLLLVAGQAAAANEFATARVSDRVGAASTAQVEGEAGTTTFAQSQLIILFGVTIMVAAGTTVFNDGCTSGC